MQNFLLAQVTAINTTNNYVKVKFLEYDNVTTKDYIPVMVPAIGEADEGINGYLKIDDLVIIAHFDIERQNPFVLGKIQSSTEFFANKKIRFYEHEIEFEEDSVTITHKEGTKVLIEDNKISFINSDSLTSIKYNDLDLIDWLKTLLGPPSTIVGNLGYSVTEATQSALLNTAIGKASTTKKVVLD